MSFKAHFVTATLAASLLGCGSVWAQVAVGPSSLGPTSPLAIAPGVPVAPTGIPLGATEMTMPGTSPAPSAAMGINGCSGAGGPMSQTTAPLFDGGGMAGASSSACTGMGGADSSTPAESTLRVGRAAIPLGSTELGNAGLSPPPPVSTMFVSPVVPSIASPSSTMGAPASTAATPPCPITGSFSDSVTVRGARSSAAAAGASGC
jgi:hypothetical protein